MKFWQERETVEAWLISTDFFWYALLSSEPRSKDIVVSSWILEILFGQT